MVELRENNLYLNGKIVRFDNGEELLLREPIEYESSQDDIYHILREMDRLDTLAYKFYSGKVEDASKFWWVIADVNQIMNPLDLTSLVGTEILIPDIIKVLFQLQQG